MSASGTRSFGPSFGALGWFYFLSFVAGFRWGWGLGAILVLPAILLSLRLKEKPVAVA